MWKMPSRPVAVEKAELNNETKPPVVGIGASAGGLEAFTALLKALPLDTGMALVLIQHLDPEHESALAEILSRATKLPVHEIENNQRVRPNEVYVIPRNVSITIERGVLKTEKRPRRGLHRPIDTFFESLAKSQGTGAIGVVLSGTASDGTLGLEAIKAEGGITFAQDASAKHSSMPRSATASGAVDLVLPPDEIAKELARIAKHPFGFRAASSLDDTQEAARAEATAHAFDDSALPSGGNPKMPAKTGRGERAPAALDEDFKKILSLLHGHSGVDFSLYKSTTIRRRIARRMVLTKHDRPSEYIDFLEGDLAELDSLYSDVLISVTSFFRNAEAFEVLKKKVFPELLSHQSDKPLRCWVLGCSTGQEAYSIAMIFLEAAEENQSTRKIQIFATDLNDSLLNKAREGYYAATLAEDISPERLRRFFIAEKGGYRIIKALRELVVFARQNVNSDPPFSHVDFISCRNLLIYFEPALQRRVIPTFHYALSPNGYLILGGSETVGGFTDLFEPVDKKHRIYQRKAGIHPAIHLPPYLSGWNVPGAESRTRSVTKDEFTGADRTHPEFGAEREADRIALNRFSPPAVLINEQLQVIQFRGPTGMCLQPPVGKASFDLLKMAKEGLMLPLRSAIDEAKQSGQATSRAGVRVKQNGGWRNFNLEVFPLKGSGERGFLVFFQPLGDTPGSSQKRPTSKAPRAKKEEAERLEQMESELLETRAAFQSSQEQYEAANEVLQAGNEEIQSANEELQSVNEELETSKEELESANEELTTLNEEMNTRNAELSRANSDLLNFHNSVQIPIVVLASDNTVRRFNPPAAALFNLLPADIGRPIRHIQHNLLIPNESGHTFVDIYEIVASTTQTLKEISLEVRDQNGRWFSLLARPYLTLDNRVDGAVLLLVDIDQAKRNEAASAHLAGVVSSSPDAIVVTDTVGHITLWNDGARNLYGYTSEEAVGKRLSALFPDEHDGSSGQFLVSSSQGTPAQRPEIRRRRKDGQLIEVWLTASSIKNSAGEVIDVVEIGRDRSELRRIQRSLQ
jgi:two-component system CheB/CheR fusion protein